MPARDSIYNQYLPTVAGDADVWGGYLNSNVNFIAWLCSNHATTGSSNAYVLTSGFTIPAYVSGQTFLIKPNFTNSGAATLNVDGLGTKAITKNGTTALASGDLVSGTVYTVTYDGTQFQVVGPMPGAFQPLDATLTALAALTITASSWIKGTGTDTFAVENASTSRTSLGLGTIATQNANSVTITGGSATGLTSVSATTITGG